MSENLDRVPPEVLKALMAEIPGILHILDAGSGGEVGGDSNEHACPGQLEHWIYAGEDGTHVAWTVWYSCENHLEILSDVVVS